MIRSPAIAAIVAGFVALDQELANGGADVGDVYRSDGPLPPRTSRATYNRVCASGAVEGARRVAGRGAGYWTCDRTAWHAARTRRPAPTLRLVESEPSTDEERAREMLRSAGFRFTREAAR